MIDSVRKIKHLVADNKLDTAFELLEAFSFNNNEVKRSVKNLYSVYTTLKRRASENSLSTEEQDLERLNIQRLLQETISKLEIEYTANNQKKRLIDRRHIDILIKHQKNSIRYFLFYSFGLILVGIIVIVIGIQFSNETMKTAMNIGGGLISSLSGLPLRELLNRKGKIKTFEILAIQLTSSNTDNVHEEDTIRLNDLVWKIIEKTALTA